MIQASDLEFKASGKHETLPEKVLFGFKTDFCFENKFLDILMASGVDTSSYMSVT